RSPTTSPSAPSGCSAHDACGPYGDSDVLKEAENAMLSVTSYILTDLPWGQLLVNGLALGSLYALTAFGIVLIYKTTKVITFAQGETAMFSTFVAFTLLTVFQLPFAVAFALTLLFAGLFGALIERVVLRHISTTTILNPVIVTVGLSLILLGAAGWIWGYE